MASGALEPDRGARSKPDWRMWPLHRLGLHRNILEAPKFTVKGCPGVRPERFENFQGFDEAPNAPLIRDAESRFRYVGTADPHPDDYAPLAQLIQRRQTLRQLHRIADYRHQH